MLRLLENNQTKRVERASEKCRTVNRVADCGILTSVHPVVGFRRPQLDNPCFMRLPR